MSSLCTLTFHSFKELLLLEILFDISNLELLLSFHHSSFLFYWANRFSWSFLEIPLSSIINIQPSIINLNLVFIKCMLYLIYHCTNVHPQWKNWIFLSSVQTLCKQCIIHTILKVVSLANIMFLRFSHKFILIIKSV